MIALIGSVVAMLAAAVPSVPTDVRAREARAIEAAIAAVPAEDRRYAPDASLVVAIIAHESGGLPRACANDRHGGSARGLMQIRLPRSRCATHRHDPMYGIETNVRRGVAILVAWGKYEERQHGGAHDVLDHYAGHRTASRYAADVRLAAARLRAMTNHGEERLTR